LKILNADDAPERPVERFPFKGIQREVKKVGIRWLSQAGPADSPDYGLRFFTVGPLGEIPIHNHFYVQTMYMLSGTLLVRSHDPETEVVLSEQEVGAGHVIFVPSMEPHSMVNRSPSQGATFLCCIANVYEEEA
jgi:quercetin dioxygenase-like cupin family protein